MDFKKNWYTVKKIRDNTYLINEQDMATMYLLTGTEKALLIDTGFGLGGLRTVVDQLTDLPLMVVNTHGHCDHVWGDYMFDEVYFPKNDLPVFNYQATEEYRRGRCEQYISKFPDFISRKEIEEWNQKPSGNIKLMEDYSTFELGGRTLKVVPLPGHTPGCIMLVDSKEKILFSGDAINQHLWMQLRDSLKITDYYAGLLNAVQYCGGITEIFHGHTKKDTGLPRTFIDDVMGDVKYIIDGYVKGYPEDHWSGPCLRIDFDNWHIWYKNI